VQALLSTEMEPLIRISQDELGDPKGNWEVRFRPAPAHADNVRQRAPANGEGDGRTAATAGSSSRER
jgi:hypothetical protein